MPDLTTTIGRVKRYNPCISSRNKYLKAIGKHSDETTVSLSSVLRICGTKDALWFLRCFEYKEYCIICAKIAESVLPIFTKSYPADDRPRKAIEETKLYYFGGSSEDELANARRAASATASASNAYVTATYAAYAANATYAAYAANVTYATYAAAAYAASATASASNASTAVFPAYAAASYASAAVVAAAYASDAVVASAASWAKVENMILEFIKMEFIK